MNSLKNPILNFRISAENQDADNGYSYNLISGEHLVTTAGASGKYNGNNTCTMVTLTREAADSTESSR
jgi:hypothetical protein